MITVQEVVTDPDLTAPEPYYVLRSVSVFTLGGLVTTTTELPQYGPVQQATNKEILMLPEADRVGSHRSFWSTTPIYVTRGAAPAPSVHGEAPDGAVPGSAYTLSQAPPGGAGDFYVNGGLLTPNVDYALVGAALSTTTPTPAGAVLWFQWPVTVDVQQAISDQIRYDGEVYKVMQRYLDPGSGYWKAIATRLSAA